MRRSWHRYNRHGSAIEIEGQALTTRGIRRSYSHWSEVAAIHSERLYVVRCAGRVIDRALSFRRARHIAEHAARAALIA